MHVPADLLSLMSPFSPVTVDTAPIVSPFSDLSRTLGLVRVQFTLCQAGLCCAPKGSDVAAGLPQCVSFNECRGHRAGLLCTACEEGYGEAYGTNGCIESSKCTQRTSFLVLACGVAVLLAAYLAFGPKSTSGLFEIISYFYQSTALLLITTTEQSLIGKRLGMFVLELLLRAC